MRIIQYIILLIFTTSVLAEGAWQTLAPGMELGTFSVGQSGKPYKSQVTILRIDPVYWSLEFTGISLTGDSNGKTARQWSRTHQFTAVINAGMFATDYQTHIGYLRFRGHVNNDNVNNYQSVAAFDRRREDLPHFRLFDLDSPDIKLSSILRDYASVVQNLRLIKRPGQNRWQRKDEYWSEAALGEDSSGRILFIFSPHPYNMHDFNNELLNLDINLVAAQHLEGGLQAQLYVNAGGVELELSGNQASDFHQQNGISFAWPIPNVLGVRPRKETID